MSWPAGEAFVTQSITGSAPCGDLTAPCDETSDDISGKNNVPFPFSGIPPGRGTHGVASVVEATADGTLPTCVPSTTTAALAAATNPTKTAPAPVHRARRRTPQPWSASSQPIDIPYRLPNYKSKN